MADTQKKIKRSEMATFLNTTPDGTSPTWSRFGKGVTSQSIAMNPTVNSEQYIHEDSATSSVDAYAPVVNTPQTCYKGEPVFEFINGLRKTRAIGDDAITQILEVDIFDTDSTGKYYAQTNEVAISVTDFGGDAGNSVTLTYDVNYRGDATEGTASITDGTVTFTAK